MYSYGKQNINNDDIKSVIKALKSDWLTQGPLIDRFEKDLRNYFGSKYCSVVSSGTSALHLVGKALNWSEKDYIITTPITFLATANSIEYQNAQTVLVDINENDYNIDLNLLEKKIVELRKHNKKLRAVIAVDYAGQPCNWKQLRYLADKYNFKLINDNCHSMGAEYNSNKKYAIKYADIVTQSFHPVKNLTTGEGGAIHTNDEKIYKKIQILKNHGISRTESFESDKTGIWLYDMKQLGFNYRITDIQCALGSSQIKRLDSFVYKKRKIATIYDNYFKRFENIKIPFINNYNKSAYHLYPLQIDFDKLKVNKIDFFNKLILDKIKLQVHYIPIYLHSYYKKKYDFKKKDFKTSFKFYSNEISLPIYVDLKIKDLDYIVGKILKNLKIN